VGSLFVIRDGSTINLADTGVTFSELSADDDGQYLATLDRTALTTKDGTPFTQQSGDGFVFSYRAEILPGEFVGASDNLFASIIGDIEAKLEEIHAKLTIVLPQPDNVTTSGDCCVRVIKIVCGQFYAAGHFVWTFDQDIDGQDVVLEIQGQEFEGTATGTTATVPLTSNQTEQLTKTTHERSPTRLIVGPEGTQHVITGKAEIL